MASKTKQGEQAPKKAKVSAAAADDLDLPALFNDGGEAWLPLLESTIRSQPSVQDFLGKGRASSIVPVRELTFQALKANAPGNWKVIIFGQTPYPRVESATGVAMLDNTFTQWEDKRFGSVTSMRCIMKSASMWKFDVPKATTVAELRTLFKKQKVVSPHQWFQAMLAQGCLLLNAGLTSSTDKAMATSKHSTFWKPIVARIVESIMAEKAEKKEGVIFAWWGSHAKALRKIVDQLALKYPDCQVVQLDHCNPAAMGDAFCQGTHFADINDALESLQYKPFDWLPTEVRIISSPHRGNMPHNLPATDLHKMYLERLQDVAQKDEQLAPVTGIMDMPVPPFATVMAAIIQALPSAQYAIDSSLQYAKEQNDAILSVDEIAVINLYTQASAFYRRLNEVLRNGNRALLVPYYFYLRLFFEAVGKLHKHRGANLEPLWRGVGLDLRKLYGKVKAPSAVSIMDYSAFKGEAEYVPLVSVLAERVEDDSNERLFKMSLMTLRTSSQVDLGARY
ncbi:uncharacterized protein MONBRDRAFT_11392 [Monosiga brevicollis MX1]|uniref:Uracil-DNA glycosylase-like domain-containing protein n=1 Tax=Monosiga brevicollis TaxID=81824 RepID=A9V943_MONBE|nr:uncharacterized protein MONBRDRAFT_11392 [Monosiga brevicollis MX1]EDQ86064.1 predicted protein [Monosiga brevicollis MX1]|eukprot:XP_001749258.1 hypothetical protein [Monosiga brevicollis MX1]